MPQEPLRILKRLRAEATATPRLDGVYTRSVYPSRTSAPLVRSPESPRLCPSGVITGWICTLAFSPRKRGSAIAAIKLWLRFANYRALSAAGSLPFVEAHQEGAAVFV